MNRVTKYTIRNVVELGAERFPDQIALTLIGDPDSTITYRKLRQMVDSMATFLISLGINKGDRIAIVGESQPNWGVAYLAIISAGAIAVPVLPDFSIKEISSILVHSGSRALVVSSRLFEKCLGFTSDGSHLLIRMEDLFHIPDPVSASLATQEEFLNAPGRDAVRMKCSSKALLERTPEEDDLASIIYTSGTTGTSKGVMLTHRNITFNADSCVEQFVKLKSGYRFLSILPLSHTYEFTIGFVLPLIVGAEIHYLGRSPAASILLPAMKKVHPHVMLSVPLLIEKIYRSSVLPQITKNPKLSRWYRYPVMRRFINRMIGRKLKATFGGHLRFFGVGGAALDISVEIFLKESGFPYAIGYGLTETSPLLAGAGPKQTKPGTTGFALEGVTLRIGDPNVETGVGEIQAKGQNIMKGYYNNEQLTKESFTEDGWYCTGDLGILQKGRLAIKGRKKTMILGSGGENIYPENIETIINNLPFVQESLVVPGNGGLAAMIKLDIEAMAENLKLSVTQAKDEALLYLSKIRDDVNKELSSYSRISDVTLQDEPFQRTPTLKIKRYLYSLKKTVENLKGERKNDGPNKNNPSQEQGN